MILLDTHVVLWFLSSHPSLPNAVKDFIRNSRQVYVSDASFWEIAIKARVSRPNRRIQFEGRPLDSDQAMLRLVQSCRDQGFQSLPTTTEACCLAPFLEGTHKDPFDRIIAAQSLLPERMTLVSRDEAFDGLSRDIHRYWPIASEIATGIRKKPSKKAF